MIIKHKIYFLLVVAFLNTQFVIPNENKNMNKLILLLGQMRSGRSCFVNNFLEVRDRIAVVGEDDGERTTIKTNFYNGETTFDYYNKVNLTLVDTKGFKNNLNHDLFLIYTIMNDLISSSQKFEYIDTIFLFYSFNQDANTIRKDIDKIKFLFGDEIVQIIKVIITKKLKLNENNKLFLNNTLSSDSINYVHLDSNCEEKINKNTLNHLFNLLNYTNSYPIVNITNKVEEIHISVDNYITENKLDNSTDKMYSYLISEYLEETYRQNFIKEDNELEKIIEQRDTYKYITSIVVSTATFVLYVFKRLFNRR
jgi:hypothetical protein